ncbi:hypothetical protein K7711_06855 [Nocardia sp. CA2R105]|uniref:hypothetical protein n=1 Tax=Nocardia coffeae TaxID=2873381 RepID=UPI001CA64A43|nr:hypothetical protein [Nocardia coffeae]MBY8856189.1 hypothetical protein [Nocardia coffeae]
MLGLGVIVAALYSAAGPYRQIREFRAVMTCEHNSGGCLDSERGSIADRRTYTTVETQTDSNGSMTTTVITHYEVTWQRADGSRQPRQVSRSFYDKAAKRTPVTLRLWHQEVVGVQVAGGAEWFLPKSGEALGYRFGLAFLGLGMLLWGLLFGWWDGILLLFFRTCIWMFMGFVLVGTTTHALAYGLNTWPYLILEIALVAIGGGMLLVSIDGS